MRGSPFQQPSVHETIRQNNEYNKHRKELNGILTAKKGPVDASQMMQSMQASVSRARNYEEIQKLKQVERDNLRMLGRFLEISKGRQLSVPKAKYQENIQMSPVYEFHSVNIISKINNTKEIKESNQRLVEKLKRVDSSVKFSTLQKDWKETKRISEMVKSSKRNNACLRSETSVVIDSQVFQSLASPRSHINMMKSPVTSRFGGSQAVMTKLSEKSLIRKVRDVGNSSGSRYPQTKMSYLDQEENKSKTQERLIQQLKSSYESKTSSTIDPVAQKLVNDGKYRALGAESKAALIEQNKLPESSHTNDLRKLSKNSRDTAQTKTEKQAAATGGLKASNDDVNDRVEDTIEDVPLGTQENQETNGDLIGAQSEGDLRQKDTAEEKEGAFARHKSSNAIQQDCDLLQQELNDVGSVQKVDEQNLNNDASQPALSLPYILDSREFSDKKKLHKSPSKYRKVFGHSVATSNHASNNPSIEMSAIRLKRREDKAKQDAKLDKIYHNEPKLKINQGSVTKFLRSGVSIEVINQQSSPRLSPTLSDGSVSALKKADRMAAPYPQLKYLIKYKKDEDKLNRQPFQDTNFKNLESTFDGNQSKNISPRPVLHDETYSLESTKEIGKSGKKKSRHQFQDTNESSIANVEQEPDQADQQNSKQIEFTEMENTFGQDTKMIDTDSPLLLKKKRVVKESDVQQAQKFSESQNSATMLAHQQKKDIAPPNDSVAMLSDFKRHGSKVMFPPINSNLQTELSSLVELKRGALHAQMLYPGLSPNQKPSLMSPIGISSIRDGGFPSTTRNSVIKHFEAEGGENRYVEAPTNNGKAIGYFIHMNEQEAQRRRQKKAQDYYMNNINSSSQSPPRLDDKTRIPAGFTARKSSYTIAQSSKNRIGRQERKFDSKYKQQVGKNPVALENFYKDQQYKQRVLDVRQNNIFKKGGHSAARELAIKQAHKRQNSKQKLSFVTNPNHQQSSHEADQEHQTERKNKQRSADLLMFNVQSEDGSFSMLPTPMDIMQSQDQSQLQSLGRTPTMQDSQGEDSSADGQEEADKDELENVQINAPEKDLDFEQKPNQEQADEKPDPKKVDKENPDPNQVVESSEKSKPQEKSSRSSNSQPSIKNDIAKSESSKKSKSGNDKTNSEKSN